MCFLNRKRVRVTRLRNLAASAVLLLFLVTTAPALADPILTLSPSTSTVDVGDTFTVSLVISGAVGVYGWQVDVSFGNTQINVLSTSKGTFLTTGAIHPPTFFVGGTLNNGVGLVDNMAETRTGVDVGATGAGLLATLTFQAVGPGVASLTIGNVVLSNASAQALTVGSLSGTTVTVNSIPEPGTLMLLISGLAGLAGLERIRGRVRE